MQEIAWARREGQPQVLRLRFAAFSFDQDDSKNKDKSKNKSKNKDKSKNKSKNKCKSKDKGNRRSFDFGAGAAHPRLRSG